MVVDCLVEQLKDIKTYALSYMVAVYVQLVFAKRNVATLSLARLCVSRNVIPVLRQTLPASVAAGLVEYTSPN